jgi:high-affinity Fe2+/Pb2+ permease
MTEQDEAKLGKLALTLSLGGVVGAVAIGMFARWVGQNADQASFLIFAAFQIAAIVLGLVSRRTPLGRASAITATIMLLITGTLMG